VEPKVTVFKALELMSTNDIGAVLVMEHGRLLGIFSERDYARKVILYGKSSKETTVGDLMTSPVITIDPKNPINDCLVLMTANHIRHVPVVEYGRVIGMATIGDIVSAVISAQESTIRDLENYITGKDFEYRPMYLGG
jgi:CBS domain-containing protein